ncbi:hypothetical protein BA184_04305 [Helicobacter pullorum]|nr:hypothetical protein BA729_02515 [Helicobacter pullorum]OCR07547.1 hypothetical protein BA185_04025 [Helicobacter pullorum]OCR10597.1 hypothetical protein BA184_04305 [Helicobacter pullorum]OCR13106.1 hypothetical protein BA730_01755 [Helicobacter pullorum]
MQKYNELLGKKLKEAKSVFFKSTRYYKKQSKKQEINKIATTSSINIEIKHFIIDICPKSMREKLTIKHKVKCFISLLSITNCFYDKKYRQFSLSNFT